MANNQSAISDVAQKGMKAASTLRSAVKVGKSIAAAAKGGAAGGWIGAVAAFAWENRRLVAAIIVGLVVMLLLPVVIIAMLPTLIFGGTGSAYSPMDADNPILNNPIVITENMEAVTTSVETVFSESLNVILEEIEQDKETLPENSNVMIVYPTVDESNINTANIISQYCAAKNQDYETVSVSDFEATIKNHKDKIYRYEKTEEIMIIEEEKTMEAVIKVEGMMCPHCKAMVEKVCKAVPGTTDAVVDLQAKIVTVQGDADVEALKKAIVDAGYEVIG